MPFSQLALRAAYAPHTSETFLDLLTITHPDLSIPIRFVNNTVDIVSRGNTYTKSAFKVTLPNQIEDGEPVASIEIQNVDRAVEQVLAGLIGDVNFIAEVILASALNVVVLGPYELPLSFAETTRNSIRLTLGDANPLLYRQFPNLRYNTDDWPGLAG